jgi:two-component system nitrogen regulation response regulator GlnG
VSRVLIVDDEPSICWGLARVARALGYRVDTASSAEHGLALAAAARPDLLMLDVRLPGMDGLAAMSAFRQHIGDAPIVVMTAFGDLGTAVTAVDNGAFEYVVKPFELAEIRIVIQRALRTMPMNGAAPPTFADASGEMLGSTSVMHAVFKRIALAAKSAAPVLLRGEGGVGKETAARAIHQHSSRRDQPFIAVNVGSLAPADAEAELFEAWGNGTAAASMRSPSGVFAQAVGGTLFFDDVDAVPVSLQVKLLRVLEAEDAQVVGASASPPVRIIAATRANLQELVVAGEFRHDLYSRLRAFDIDLPPLRERSADITLLAQHFASRFSVGAAVLADETLAELEQRPWHGNVSELRSAIEHAIVVARTGAVLPVHLPAPLPPLGSGAQGEIGARGASLNAAVASLAKSLLESSSDRGDVYERFLEEVEPPLLATALLKNGNRCAPAARALGLHRTTLKRKLDQYGIDDAGER